jgi:hypothetical protein
MLSHILALLSIFGLAHAGAVTKRQVITTLSSAEIESFKPYTLYAGAAYCQPSLTLSWSCGGMFNFLGRSTLLSGHPS